MQINTIKLVTGEEVVADVSATGEGRLKLKNPVKLQMYPPQVAGGQPTMGFGPFPTFAAQKAESEILIEPLHVVYMYVPDEEIVNQYNQIFGSGIITPPTKQIITG
jgi:hypothetical protein